MKGNLINIRVWGDFACFTRPEMKVERVSYPLMTPSAARGILEAIFWKPEMFYLIDAIRVVKKGVWTSFRRNEVSKAINFRDAPRWMRGEKEVQIIKSDDTGSDIEPKRSSTRTQRNMLALRDVEYIVSAEIRVSEIGRRGGNPILKYTEEAKRRIKSGKCFHRPALGVREFSTDFDLVENPDEELERRINENVSDYAKANKLTEAEVREKHSDKNGLGKFTDKDLGLMLYDVFAPSTRAAGFRFVHDEDFTDAETPLLSSPVKKPKANKNQILTDGVLVNPSASFFLGEIKDSVMDCHPERVSIIHKNGGAN